jgi:hypothetical protein
MKLIDQTGCPFFYVMTSGPFPAGYEPWSPRADHGSFKTVCEAVAAGDHAPLEDERLFPPPPGLPREVEALDGYGLVVDARPGPVGGNVLARVLPLVPRGSYFGARAAECRWYVWAPDGQLRHGCDPGVVDANWAGDDLLVLGPGEGYRLELRRPPALEVSLEAEFAQVHNDDAARECTPQWLHALAPPRYWEVMSATPDGEQGSDVVEVGPDAIHLRYSTPDEHLSAIRLTLSPDARRLVYVASMVGDDAGETAAEQLRVVAVDLAAVADERVTCHRLIGVPGPPLPDVTLAFGPGGELRVEAGDRAGTFPAPLPPALSLTGS